MGSYCMHTTAKHTNRDNMCATDMQTYRERRRLTDKEGINSPPLLYLPFNSDVCSVDEESYFFLLLRFRASEMSKHLLWLVQSCTVSLLLEKEGECHCNCSMKTTVSLSLFIPDFAETSGCRGENFPPH